MILAIYTYCCIYYNIIPLNFVKNKQRLETLEKDKKKFHNTFFDLIKNEPIFLLFFLIKKSTFFKFLKSDYKFLNFKTFRKA